MQKLNRVVVTGMSVCAPNGIGRDKFEKSTLAGVSGCDYVQNFNIPKEFSQVAGIISDFYPETQFCYNDANSNHDIHERQNKIAQFCIDEALAQAELTSLNRRYKRQIDLFLATAIGPMISMEYGFIRNNVLNKSMGNDTHNNYSFRYFTQQLARQFALNGMDLTIPTGCVGGCDAFAYALNAIRLGKSECAIVGAVEAPITPLVVNAFGKIQATSTRVCLPQEASCPFDNNRDGFVLGEGAGILILESEHSAIERGAKILAEIKGSGSNNNCFHMTDITSSGDYIEQSCMLALKDANLTVSDIDYINAHGSSTRQNDVAESMAFNRLFANNIANIPVTSIKSQNGHALAAASAIEVVSIIQTLQSQKIPPTINLQNIDPSCSLNIVTDNARNYSVKNVLKTSSGFSGIHTAMIIGEYKELS